MAAFTIGLKNLRRLSLYSVVTKEVKRAFEPIVAMAGHTLKVDLGSAIARGSTRGGISIEFVYRRAPRYRMVQGPTSTPTIHLLGNGSGNIFVYEAKDIRFGGGPIMTRARPGAHPVDHISQLQRILNTDLLVAKACANTAVHELAHMIATLPHVTDPTNFMYAGRAGKTLKAEQINLAGKKQFSSGQIKKMVAAIRSGNLTHAGFQSRHVPRPTRIQTRPGAARP